LLRGQRRFHFVIAPRRFKLKRIRQTFMRSNLFPFAVALGAFIINAAALKLK
jgi:hypothetical protein